jgi:hypothetical protein
MWLVLCSFLLDKMEKYHNRRMAAEVPAWTVVKK